MARKSAKRCDGRSFSPVIRANAKFHGPSLCVDVRFASVKELDQLIASLVKLREFTPEGYDHIHLQDHGLRRSKSDAASAEVTFWHPSVKRGDIENRCVAEARRRLVSPRSIRKAPRSKR
ncbi:MAG: hypothetical protein NTW19_25195 [Planctomycetota bacterium]|nr:hypothetical protein [Planctomycetota bacterium]